MWRWALSRDCQWPLQRLSRAYQVTSIPNQTQLLSQSVSSSPLHNVGPRGQDIHFPLCRGCVCLFRRGNARFAHSFRKFLARRCVQLIDGNVEPFSLNGLLGRFNLFFALSMVLWLCVFCKGARPTPLWARGQGNEHIFSYLESQWRLGLGSIGLRNMITHRATKKFKHHVN